MCKMTYMYNVNGVVTLTRLNNKHGTTFYISKCMSFKSNVVYSDVFTKHGINLLLSIVIVLQWQKSDPCDSESTHHTVLLVTTERPQYHIKLCVLIR